MVVDLLLGAPGHLDRPLSLSCGLKLVVGKGVVCPHDFKTFEGFLGDNTGVGCCLSRAVSASDWSPHSLVKPKCQNANQPLSRTYARSLMGCIYTVPGKFRPKSPAVALWHSYAHSVTCRQSPPILDHPCMETDHPYMETNNPCMQ